MSVPDHLRLTPHELCIAVPIGQAPDVLSLPLPNGRSPRAALEDAVAGALARPPCLVSFSGGRDSSAILALACHVARTRGLEAPIAVTHRFPQAPETDEREWQEVVVGRARPEGWLRLEWTDELDMLGPRALAVLDRHGPLFPHNAHFMDLMVERAAGGSLLTGVGGDELFGTTARPLATALCFARRRPARRELRRLALELAPRALRVEVGARRSPFAGLDWIRPAARVQIGRAFAAAEAEHPLRWDRGLAHFWSSRYARAALATLEALGEAHGTRVISPFFDPGVLAACAARFGAAGMRSREDGLRELHGDLLPERLIERRGKARFDAPLFGPVSRTFVERWSGDGVDGRLVDTAALRAQWRSERPAGNSFALIHRAWLAERGDGRASVS